MIRVAIVDDHAVVRKGLTEFLVEHEDFEIVGEASNGNEALNMVRSVLPDVLVLDISMPGQSGIEILASLQARAPDMAILILSGMPEEHYALNLIRRGAQGYLNKGCEPDDIVIAIRTVAQGRRYISAVVAQLLAGQLNRNEDEPAHKHLSNRELQVFIRLAKGEAVGEIAEGMSLSVKTVSTYRTRLMEKMSLSSNSDLTYYAIKNALIE
jgi:two-component system, NarL family, invasion response regulator UvrY